jgi:lysophospholipase L1-like esterase
MANFLNFNFDNATSGDLASYTAGAGEIGGPWATTAYHLNSSSNLWYSSIVLTAAGKIRSNTAAGQRRSLYIAAVTPPSDYTIVADLKTVTVDGNAAAGVFLRHTATSTTITGYLLARGYAGTFDGWHIFKYSGETATKIDGANVAGGGVGAGPIPTDVAGNTTTFGLTGVGNTLTAKVGSISWTVTDSTYTSGAAGVFFNSGNTTPSDTVGWHLDIVSAAPPVVAQLAVTGPSGAVATAGTVALGSLLQSSTQSLSLTVTNNGLASAALDTPTYTNCTVTTAPSTPLAASGGSTTVVVTIPTTSLGAYAGSISIPSNDPLSPYVVNITATVVAAAAAISGYTLTGPASGAWNVASTAFTVTPNGQLAAGNNFVVTPTDSAGGTFSPTSLTFVPNGSLAPPSQTFTYRPPAVGTTSVTATNTYTPGGVANPAGVSYVANPITTAYPVTNANIYQSGYFQVTNSVFPIAGDDALLTRGSYSRITLRGRGSSCVLTAYSASVAGSIQISVDGGAATTPTLVTTSTATSLTLWTGLSDAYHTVEIITNSNVYIDTGTRLGTGGAYGATLTTNGCIQLTGSAPALQAPPGFGPTLLLSGNSTNVAYQGEATVGPNWIAGVGLDGYTMLQSSWQMSTFRISVTTVDVSTDLKIWTQANGSRFNVIVDEVESTPFNVASDSIYQWYTLASALPAGTHVIDVNVLYGAVTVRTWIYALMLSQPGASFNAKPALRPQFAPLGDSITVCQIGTTNRPELGWPWIIARRKGWAVCNRGLDGNYLYDTGGNTGAGVHRASQITTLTLPPVECAILFGANDYTAPVSAANFQTAMTSLLSDLTTGTTSTKFHILSTLPRNANVPANQAVRAGYATGIQAAIASNGSSRLAYVPTGPWNMAGTGGDAGQDFTLYLDSAHPNPAGNVVMANNFYPYLTLLHLIDSGPLGFNQLTGVH